MHSARLSPAAEAKSSNKLYLWSGLIELEGRTASKRGYKVKRPRASEMRYHGPGSQVECGSPAESREGVSRRGTVSKGEHASWVPGGWLALAWVGRGEDKRALKWSLTSYAFFLSCFSSTAFPDWDFLASIFCLFVIQPLLESPQADHVEVQQWMQNPISSEILPLLEMLASHPCRLAGGKLEPTHDWESPRSFQDVCCRQTGLCCLYPAWRRRWWAASICNRSWCKDHPPWILFLVVSCAVQSSFIDWGWKRGLQKRTVPISESEAGGHAQLWGLIDPTSLNLGSETVKTVIFLSFCLEVCIQEQSQHPPWAEP